MEYLDKIMLIKVEIMENGPGDVNLNSNDLNYLETQNRILLQKRAS